jgi:hypothetical protein
MRMGVSRALLWVLAAGAGVAGAQTQEPGEDKEPAVEALLATVEAAAGRPLDPSFRARSGERLGRLSLEELSARRDRAATSGLGEPSVPGDPNRDLVYTPVAPCRVADTRVAGGSLGAGTTRDWRVGGVGLQGQGGDPSGCGIPAGPATAAVLNFVAINPVGPGNLRAWAYATPPAAPPTASILNYAQVTGLNIANGLVVPLCDVTVTTCPFDLRVQADVSGTHVLVDVVGYFHRLDVGKINVMAESSSNPQVNLTTTCTTLRQVTINVPRAGRVLLTATAVFYLLHNQGTVSTIFADAGPTQTACGEPGGVGHYMRYLSAAATDGYHVETGSFTRVHSVPGPGSYTFYFNAAAAVSPSVETVGYPRLVATFFPD